MARTLVAALSVLIGTVGAAPAPAQGDTVQTIRQALSAPSSRKWVFARIVNRMGSGSGCISGESWRFNADGTLLVRRCESGRWVDRSLRYSLRQQGPIDVAITLAGPDARFGGERRVRITDNGRKLIVRAVSASKDTMQEDIVFSRSGG